MKNRISMHAFLMLSYTVHVIVTEIRLHWSISWTWTIVYNKIITYMGTIYGLSLWNHYLYSSREAFYALHGFTLVSLALSSVKVIRTKRTAGSFSNLSLTSVTVVTHIEGEHFGRSTIYSSLSVFIWIAYRSFLCPHLLCMSLCCHCQYLASFC